MMRPTLMKILNIIGAGRAGRTLAALWFQQGVFAIQDILNRTPASASDAIAFIGAGRACASVHDMQPADLWLIATPDGEIAHAGQTLAASGLLRAGDVVFQLSGATPSQELSTMIGTDARVASVHPLKSFADPAQGVRLFAGAYCAAEGSVEALAVLRPAFEYIGARVTEIDAQFKTVYHAASVMVCNYLTALMEAGLQCYEKAGLPRVTASAMMEPLVRETVDNNFRLGTATALTGPIARGDHAVVARQLDVLRAFDPHIAEIYRVLGITALDLARTRGGVDAAALRAMEKALGRP